MCGGVPPGSLYLFIRKVASDGMLGFMGRWVVQPRLQIWWPEEPIAYDAYTDRFFVGLHISRSRRAIVKLGQRGVCSTLTQL